MDGQISLVVADEVHLLNEAERGPTLEIVLARLMQVNPHIQILALSATINNVDEIAGWLKAKYIVTEWRPINLKEGVAPARRNPIQRWRCKKNRAENPATPVINLVLNTLKKGGQALVFASTRRNAVSASENRCGHMNKACQNRF